MSEFYNFNRPYHVLLVGDSITELSDTTEEKGYTTLLRNEYNTRANFINLGMSTSTTKQWLDIVTHSEFKNMIPPKIDRIYLGLGTNDASGALEPGVGLTKEEYRTYLQELYEILKANVCKDIVFLVPTPVKKKANKDPVQTEEYAQVCREVAKGVNSTILDIRSKIKPGDEFEIDGVHFNQIGNRYMYELIEENMGNVEEWFHTLPNWKFCPSFNEELDSKTNTCGCKENFYLVNDKCEECPNDLKHTPDKLSCQCPEYYKFDLALKKCICFEENMILQNEKCVCKNVEQAQLLKTKLESNNEILPVILMILTIVMMMTLFTIVFVCTKVSKNNKKEELEAIQ